MATEVLWWFFAVAIVGVSAGVVFSRSVIHSAIFLILSLAGIGAMYVFLTVEFLALVQFLIYGGAVTVLILLALMLTRMDATGRAEAVDSDQRPFALAVGVALIALLVSAMLDTSWASAIPDSPANIPIGTISEKLFVEFGAPFVIASALLLVALVGAIILARQEEGE
ncbi:MAG: NADH-quinone oxidoreductase subunit J [Dehalococcoidia bacterium]|nr:NADH-quinone oxidoreductase subunit J [Dehalococcoidia bacterium]